MWPDFAGMITENLKIEIFSWVISVPNRITNVLLREGGKRFRVRDEELTKKLTLE